MAARGLTENLSVLDLLGWNGQDGAHARCDGVGPRRGCGEKRHTDLVGVAVRQEKAERVAVPPAASPVCGLASSIVR